jgi:hypothetical protein
MTRRRRRTTAALLAVAGSAAVVALLVAPANAQAPDTAAWWNAANVGNGAPEPPAPPDVPAGDLLVQGSNGNGSAPTLPVSGAPATSQAVAGLRFDLPDGASVGALTLTIDGTPPPSAPTIVACKATQSFAAVENGPWSSVPPSDCSQTSNPKLSSDGTKLVFDDISKLVSDGQLSITLLPGALDRVVIKKPDDSALTVMTSGGVGLSAPPLGTGSNAGPASSGAGAVPVAPVGGAAVLPQASGADAGSAVAPPVVAPSQPAGQPASQPVASTAGTGTGGLSTTQRRVLAGVVIALELLGFLLLMGDRDVERLALAPALATAAGGRLRPPDRGGQVRVGAVSVGGVGRFRTERRGPAPRL